MIDAFKSALANDATVLTKGGTGATDLVKGLQKDVLAQQGQVDTYKSDIDTNVGIFLSDFGRQSTSDIECPGKTCHSIREDQ